MPKFRRKPVIVHAERRPSGMWDITSPPHLGLVHDVEFRQEFEAADDEAEKMLGEASTKQLSPLDIPKPGS